MYKSEQVTEDETTFYKIDFENKMYINTAKYLNCLCYEINEPNFYVKKTRRYIILRQPWTF